MHSHRDGVGKEELILLSRNNVENGTIIIERTSEIGLALAAINRAHYPVQLAFDGTAQDCTGYICVSHCQLMQSQGCIDIKALCLQGVCGKFVFREVFPG